MMKAAVLHDFNDLREEEVPRPEAKETGTVVVEIRSCGVCQTDYKAVTGARKNVSFPFIPGHEPSGVVVEKLVKGLSIVWAEQRKQLRTPER